MHTTSEVQIKLANPVVSLVTLVLAAACAQPGPKLAAAPDADVKAVAQILATIDSCSRTGALDVFLGYVADDIAYLAPDQPAVVGKEAVGALYRNLWGAVIIDMRHVNAETHVVGDLVVARGDARGTVTPRAGGPSTTFDNKYLMLFKRQADGALKFWRVAANTNAPLAPPTAAPPAAKKK